MRFYSQLATGCHPRSYAYETTKVHYLLLKALAWALTGLFSLYTFPCSGSNGFRVVIVLPRDTNLPLDAAHEGGEDGHLTAKNKWLIGHPEGGLPEGSPLGLIGENITLD